MPKNCLFSFFTVQPPLGMGDFDGQPPALPGQLCSCKQNTVDTLSTLRSVAHQQRCYFQLLDAADQELQEATEQPVLVSLLLP